MAAFLILSGCIFPMPAPKDSFTQLPEVRSFLDENPNAQVTVIFLGESFVRESLPRITEKCGTAIEVKPYYQATIAANGERIIAYLDEQDFHVICLFRETLPPEPPEPPPSDECETNSNCNDYDNSTIDECNGEPKKCSNTEITGCIGGDDYCPNNCTYLNDAECEMPTCSEQGGEICAATQECIGQYLDAFDIDYCCSECEDKEVPPEPPEPPVIECGDSDGKCPIDCDYISDSDCEEPTCFEKGGEVCSSGQACTSSYIPVIDSEMCCPTQCITTEVTCSNNDGICTDNCDVGNDNDCETQDPEPDGGIETYVEGDIIEGLNDEDGNEIKLKIVRVTGSYPASGVTLGGYRNDEYFGTCSLRAGSELSCGVVLDHKIFGEKIDVSADNGVGYIEITREKRVCEYDDYFCPGGCDVSNDNDCGMEGIGEAGLEYFKVTLSWSRYEGESLSMKGPSEQNRELKLMQVSQLGPSAEDYEASLAVYENDSLVGECSCNSITKGYACESFLHESNKLYCTNVAVNQQTGEGYFEFKKIEKTTALLEENNSVTGLFSPEEDYLSVSVSRVYQVTASPVSFEVSLNLRGLGGTVIDNQRLAISQETRFKDENQQDILDDSVKVVSINIK